MTFPSHTHLLFGTFAMYWEKIAYIGDSDQIQATSHFQNIIIVISTSDDCCYQTSRMESVGYVIHQIKSWHAAMIGSVVCCQRLMQIIIPWRAKFRINRYRLKI